MKFETEITLELPVELYDKLLKGEAKFVPHEMRYSFMTGETWEKLDGEWIKTSPEWTFK